MSPLSQRILDQCAVLAAIKPYCDEAPVSSDDIGPADLEKLQKRAAVMVPCWERALARLVSLCDGYSGEPGV